MELHEALQRVKFDKRLLDWHIRQGTITQAEVDKHLNALPDSGAQALKLDIETVDHDTDNGTFTEQ